ncbi:hypothetical protein ASG17_07785 [Brevundimonas sp. Leaf363]|uniref:hypothetical protein n=1 Tax=Brevundimonas sp. Leaf363 TaxID=1736353 RepID=UPI0006FB9003|nr:hypothetical protein [Brevundimonas sp. Leaf363]KQS55943.1 hypothetical protein ASG17_07785 [Brevundimonas sp. Leaf363]
MSDAIDLFYAKADACNPVKIGGRTNLLGDPDIKPEKPHTIIGFPGGDVEIARTEDGDYWIHVAVRTDHRGDGEPKGAGQIIRARIDASGRYSDAANAALNDEIEEGAVEHIAFLVRPGFKPSRSRK